MVSRHFLVSSVVTSIVVGLFAFFVYKNGQNGHFKLSEEYQMIPDGFVLPKGCDIRVDMQTGETWAKIAMMKNSDSLIILKEEEKQIPKGGAPEYKNITKNRIQSRLSVEMQKALESALTTLSDQEESWNFLEEEASAIEFEKGNEKSLQILSICLQNNPLAVEKFEELEIHRKELETLIKSEKMTIGVFKKVLRILESFKVHGKDEKFKFIESVEENVKRHLKEHENGLQERYIEIAELLIRRDE